MDGLKTFVYIFQSDPRIFHRQIYEWKYYFNEQILTKGNVRGRLEMNERNNCELNRRRVEHEKLTRF